MKFLNLYNILLQNRLNDYKLQLKDQQLANSIFSLNDPKKEKMIIKWIKNGSIKYPKDIDIIDKVYQIINRKQLDFNKYNSPQQILDQYKDLNQKINYNPDNQKCFTNKTQLGKGVVVYNVQDDMEGLKAVRKAVDYNWGKDSNPWCLITPPLEEAEKYWQQYNKIPKRICFQNGKLIAFCANDDYEILWWDREDKETKNIPIEGVEDDPNALKEIQQFKQAKQDSKTSNNPKRLQQIYQKYKNDEQIKLNLALNPNCPSNILQKLSNDKGNWVRITVAKNSNTPSYILQKLSNDEDVKIRKKIARNPNCSPEILQKLSNDENMDIKLQIVVNPNTSLDTLKKLSVDRRCNNELYYNPNIHKVITKLWEKNIDSNFLKEIYQKYGFIRSILLLISKNLNCPPDILKELSNNNMSYIKHNVVENPNCPIEILQKLSNDDQNLSREENNYIKQLIIQNPKTPSFILQKLSKEKSYISNMAKKELNKRK